MGVSKTTEQHAAEVAAIGKVQLVGEYKGARTKTPYYCPAHDFYGDALPTNVLKGRGLACCAGRNQNTQTHAERVKELGRVELVGEYVRSDKSTQYRCLLHDEVHEALPTNVLAGHGLVCCQRTLAAESNIERSREQYDERLAELGHLVRIGPYGKNNKERILHRCTIHGEEGLQSPNAALQGTGLDCCLRAGRQAQADKKKAKAIKQLNQELHRINPNLEWVGGEYVNNSTHMLFRCKKHDEVHRATWAHVRRGWGLKCCRLENLSGIGKRSLNRFNRDTVWRALLGRNDSKGNAWLYLYESPEPGFNKFGISNELEKRAKQGGYGKQLITPRFFADRDDCVLIEQAFLFGYGSEPPEALADWKGNTELTTLGADAFLEVIEELETALVQMGRWTFAEEYCDPREVKRAIAEKDAS